MDGFFLGVDSNAFPAYGTSKEKPTTHAFKQGPGCLHIPMFEDSAAENLNAQATCSTLQRVPHSLRVGVCPFP